MIPATPDAMVPKPASVSDEAAWRLTLKPGEAGTRVAENCRKAGIGHGRGHVTRSDGRIETHETIFPQIADPK